MQLPSYTALGQVALTVWYSAAAAASLHSPRSLNNTTWPGQVARLKQLRRLWSNQTAPTWMVEVPPNRPANGEAGRAGASALAAACVCVSGREEQRPKQSGSVTVGCSRGALSNGHPDSARCISSHMHVQRVPLHTSLYCTVQHHLCTRGPVGRLSHTPPWTTSPDCVMTPVSLTQTMKAPKTHRC